MKKFSCCGRLTGLVWVLCSALVSLAGCAGGPAERPELAAPSNPAHPLTSAQPTEPPDIAQIPDAEPQIEPIRSGGPNKPYVVLGQSYTPLSKDAPLIERGVASWYGPGFHGKRTASGEVYNMHAMTAAHKTLPIPSYAKVRNPANGREVILRINDRGPFHAGRIVDLSYTAARKLDLHRGVGPVELQRITPDDVRSGAWRQPPSGEPPNPVGVEAVANAMAEVPQTPTDAAAVLPTAPVLQAPSMRAYTPQGRGFWVQLGAFSQRLGAESFQERVSGEADWLVPLLAVFNDASLFRLQAGPYVSREAASTVAERVRATLQLTPVIVHRR
jgi:rare lipoprotein A